MLRQKLDLTDDATTVESSPLAQAQRRAQDLAEENEKLRVVVHIVSAALDNGTLLWWHALGNAVTEDKKLADALEALDAQSREAVKP